MNAQENIFNDLGNALASFVANLFIIEYGIVQKVVADGVVEVQLSVALKEREMKVITCTLLNIASSACTLNVVPEKGDKVLVLFPRRFSPDMFDPDKKNTFVDNRALSYSLLGSFAILINQFKDGKHKNFIKIEKGKVDLQLGYSEEEGKTTVNVKTTNKGDIEVTTPKITSTFDKEGNISVSNENVTLAVKNDGTIDLTNGEGKAKVKIESSGAITIDANGGKLTLKNAQTSLKDVITKIINAVDKLTTTGSPTNHTASPGQMLESRTELAKLM